MSWWGSSSKPTESKRNTLDSSSDSYQSAPSYDFGHDVSSSPSIQSGSAPPVSGFQQQLVAEQQKALVQAVMFKLTEISFEQCVPKPSTSLSSSETSCINAVVTKYLDTSEFVVGKLSQQR